ncbi:inositol-3-phosphate synthase [Blastopirellula sp. JC732]|uniref:Inositol-3-phosphate synthase n=1 Tax=Blastopirellula sediminis TaxID=2894196 RepID=A0A9X1MPS3_9BACT|nr:inositol-3-phosphate synthase [Blastopirellula sediminis]MCC9606020.1 inositol-3-phosphate synthase [Blastopirellula sediminis]MCC9630681.1 inositol-3-phosphate synthase [Blastopirellula sediminis]
MARSRVGIWLIGARGGVAATTIVGLVALRRGLVDTVGLVSELPQFADLGLTTWDNIVIGGHEIRNVTLYDAAQQLVDVSRALDPRLVAAAKEDLDAIDANIKDGTLLNVGAKIAGLAKNELREKTETPRQAISRIQADISAFAKQHELSDVIVINVSSTEPPFDDSKLPTSWNELAPLLESGDCHLPASSLYGAAALELGFPYVNFTPSVGASIPALCDLAEQKKTCHMGHDGKTGETLLKSTLAPMFAHRNLEVMSWVGHNIFGNMDAVVLDDPENKKTKATSKDRLLGQIFGYHPQTLVTIERIDSMGDWKTAWDHIHFRGFLGTPMVMQFIWQGADSLLAAPLVIDLARFAELAHRRGETGLLTSLACFFKSPHGTGENDFSKQFSMLEAWAKS